ncbi:MAG: hypothetical protein EP333_02250 [Bacteroidetes bacterium]|nr:MAG: hypothetical protein EP333_02250 [Bacteroidota bacterium]
MRNQYKHIAEVFRYPMEGYRLRMEDCYNYLLAEYPKAAEKFESFVEYVRSHSDFEIEEIFGKTFHIQAICYLDIGYVLFAEDYKRGEFLVQMKKEQEKLNNDCGEELADNLPNVLSLMAILPDEEFLSEFGERVMKPAIKKMLQEFEESRMELKDKVRRKKQKVVLMEEVENKNIYQNAIEALQLVVNTDFNENRFDDPEIIPTLGGTIGTVLSGNCDTSCSPKIPKPEEISL